MSVTLKFQSSGTMPGSAAPVTMQGGSLTVGRGPANDLVLPDPDRVLSKSHCVIEDHNGNVVVVDLSTNGTFLNYSKIPLGRIPTPLNNGDVLNVGPYELVVEIGSGRAAPDDLLLPPADAAGISHGLADRAPDPLKLLEDVAEGGDFLDDLLGKEGVPTGPSQLNPVDPIDELLPPMGDDDDPFFHKPDDGRDGGGASLPMHNPSAQDSFTPQATAQPGIIPDDWDDLLAPEPTPAQPAPTFEPGPQIPPDPLFSDPLFSDPPDTGNPDPLPPESVPPAPDPLATEIPTPKPKPAPLSQAAPLQATPSQAELTRATVPPDPTPDPTPAAPPAAAVSPATPSDAARAFLDNLGADEVAIADADLANTMARMGRIMKSLVTGLREILMTRTSIKSEFRIEQTMIGAGGNNPLKFSISPEQAIEAMVRPATKGYLNPETAAQEALEDIKAHEVAMVTGMEAALKGVLARLDPEILSGKIESAGGIGGLLKGRKARYWEVYEKMYSEISDQAENDFHDLFSREFARAYKEQLDKLKQN